MIHQHDPGTDSPCIRMVGLTEQEQAGLTAWILEEIAAERRWETAFADSADMLAQLADEALAEHRHGKTQALDPDQL